MPRDYPPLTIAQAVSAAEHCAATWHGPPQAAQVNYGNQDTEYIQAGEAAAIKQRWRDAGVLYGYERAAGDSDSANGLEIDVKLRPDEHSASVFNYHLRMDTQTIKVQGPTKAEKKALKAEQEEKKAEFNARVKELERQEREKRDARNKAAKKGGKASK